jgi:(R,R)-butanediol dehydrogenase/meso-butanediol dehydrogenase/diacetyl reductase
MTTMRAAVYYGDHDVRIEDREVPVAAPGEALVRVLRSGICGTDASEWKSGPKMFPVNHRHPGGHLGPMILGHEFIGSIESINGDSSFSVGDLVASGAGISCGRCVRCLEGRTNLCLEYVTLGLNRDGGMAEFVAVPLSTLVPIPPGLSLDRASLAQPLAVGLHAARRSRAKDGDSVVLIGAGAIGTFVLAALLASADVTVTVVDFPGARLERALRLGAHHVVEAGDDLRARVLAVAGSGGADVAIEASGAPGQLDVALGMVRRGGTLLQVGLPTASQQLDVHHLVMSEIVIETTLAHVCSEDLAPALEVLATTDLADELLEGTFALDDVAAQLERLATGQVPGKIIFDPHAA